MTGDGTVGSVRKSPFPQRRLRLPGAIVRITFGKKPSRRTFSISARVTSADSEPAMKLDPRPGMETGKVWAGKLSPVSAFLEVAAPGHEVVPLRSGQFTVVGEP